MYKAKQAMYTCLYVQRKKEKKEKPKEKEKERNVKIFADVALFHRSLARAFSSTPSTQFFGITILFAIYGPEGVVYHQRFSLNACLLLCICAFILLFAKNSTYRKNVSFTLRSLAFSCLLIYSYHKNAAWHMYA